MVKAKARSNRVAPAPGAHVKFRPTLADTALLARRGFPFDAGSSGVVVGDPVTGERGELHVAVRFGGRRPGEVWWVPLRSVEVQAAVSRTRTRQNAASSGYSIFDVRRAHPAWARTASRPKTLPTPGMKLGRRVQGGTVGKVIVRYRRGDERRHGFLGRAPAPRLSSTVA